MLDERQRRILVVEDEPAILTGIKDVLEDEGYSVVTATDGHLGLKLALEHDPDLILLDVMMPRMSGFDVLRKLREHRIRGSVILLTAKKAEEDKVKGLKLGADDYVTKPFSLVELLARVQAVLRRTEPPADPLRDVCACSASAGRLGRHPLRPLCFLRCRFAAVSKLYPARRHPSPPQPD